MPQRSVNLKPPLIAHHILSWFEFHKRRRPHEVSVSQLIRPLPLRPMTSVPLAFRTLSHPRDEGNCRSGESQKTSYRIGSALCMAHF